LAREVPMPRWIALIAALTACAAPAGDPAAPSRAVAAARVDHIIVGVGDLDSGIDALERLTGVRPVMGGAHPGRGTRNALLSLGPGTYLELYAPNPAEPVDSPELAELRGLGRPTPLGWAVSSDDMAALRRRLAASGLAATAPERGSRLRPDGRRLRWATFEIENLDDPLAPFFIAWRDPDLHPSRTSPAGCTLAAIALRDPAPERLGAVVEALGLPVGVAASAERRMTVWMDCPRGRVTVP
jgi:catechol 2,3-dioxygenase-like lactoylglutathione lyase family enzyme